MFELGKPQDDGLITPEVGPWSADKHHFLRRYLDAFTTAMKHKRWNGLHYIDLFASAGIERIKDGPLEWGSSLIAAQAPNKFAQLHLCELDKTKCDALRERLNRFQQPTAPQILNGDANAKVKEVVTTLPQGSLSLAFLDPYGLHLDFETVRELSKRRADLIIFFPDHLDALRNWNEYYYDNPDSNLDRFLGYADWRAKFKTTPRSEFATALGDLYKERLRSLGYLHFDEERIAKSDGRYLYKLIFCTCSDAGITIWRNVSLRKPDGQGTFNW